MKNPNNDDTKTVAADYSKSASNLLNPIKQSNMITQKLETAEKPNTFDIESIAIKYLKNWYQNIKAHKKAKTLLLKNQTKSY